MPNAETWCQTKKSHLINKKYLQDSKWETLQEVSFDSRISWCIHSIQTDLTDKVCECVSSLTVKLQTCSYCVWNPPWTWRTFPCCPRVPLSAAEECRRTPGTGRWYERRSLPETMHPARTRPMSCWVHPVLQKLKIIFILSYLPCVCMCLCLTAIALVKPMTPCLVAV